MKLLFHKYTIIYTISIYHALILHNTTYFLHIYLYWIKIFQFIDHKNAKKDFLEIYQNIPSIPNNFTISRSYWKQTRCDTSFDLEFRSSFVKSGYSEIRWSKLKADFRSWVSLHPVSSASPILTFDFYSLVSLSNSISSVRRGRMKTIFHNGGGFTWSANIWI